MLVFLYVWIQFLQRHIDFISDDHEVITGVICTLQDWLENFCISSSAFLASFFFRAEICYLFLQTSMSALMVATIVPWMLNALMCQAHFNVLGDPATLEMVWTATVGGLPALWIFLKALYFHFILFFGVDGKMFPRGPNYHRWLHRRLILSAIIYANTFDIPQVNGWFQGNKALFSNMQIKIPVYLPTCFRTKLSERAGRGICETQMTILWQTN